jgi:hypothetical protein
MADDSSRRPRSAGGPGTGRPRGLSQPYHVPARVHLVMFSTIMVMIMAAAIMIPTGHLTWTWIFPAAATAGSVYAYLHVRAAKTLVRQPHFDDLRR